MRKKASLQLSINAIVVLILAITILGLGLGFIKKQFGSATKQFDVVNDEMESSIISELESSGQLLTLKRTKFEVESGSPEQFYFGVRNTASSETCFYFQFKCISALAGTTENPGECPTGWDDATTHQWTWFQTFRSKLMDGQSSAAVLAELQATGASDTYTGKLIVWTNAPTSGACPAIYFNADGTAPTGASKYETKEFYIEVV